MTGTQTTTASATVLTHGGPWAERTLREIALGFQQNATVRFETYRPGEKKNYLTEAFEYHRSHPRENNGQATEEESVWIARCRFLRALSFSKALENLRNMRKAWGDVLENAQPVAVFSEAIDSYVISTLENACKARAIPFFGLVTSFINGYCRSTRYGELAAIREPSSDEIVAVHKMLANNNYRPDFLPKRTGDSHQVLKSWAKNWLRYFKFLTQISIPRNRDRNHIVGGLDTSLKNLHLWPRFNIGSQNWKQRIDENPLPSVFVPLQFVPEATIDYWCKDVDLIRHDEVLIEFIDQRASQFQFIIKEHPNAKGLRSPRLYDKLCVIDNVVLVPTHISVEEVISQVQSTLTWTGSVGLQTALQGKPVFNFCNAYYIIGRFFKVINSTTSCQEMVEHLKCVSARQVSEGEQFELIEHVLAGMVQGKLKFGHNQTNPTEEEKKRYRAIGASLKEGLRGL